MTDPRPLPDDDVSIDAWVACCDNTAARDHVTALTLPPRVVACQQRAALDEELDSIPSCPRRRRQPHALLCIEDGDAMGLGCGATAVLDRVHRPGRMLDLAHNCAANR